MGVKAALKLSCWYLCSALL